MKTTSQTNFYKFHGVTQKTFFFQKDKRKSEIQKCCETKSENIQSKNYTFNLILQNTIFALCLHDIQYHKFGYFFTLNGKKKKTKFVLKNSLSQKFFFSSDFLKFFFFQLTEENKQTKRNGLIYSHHLYFKKSESKGYLFFFPESWYLPYTQKKHLQVRADLKKKRKI